MFPVLLEIPVFGGFPIYTYGLLVALAFLAGIYWTTREARISGVSKEVVLDLAFYLVLSALIGSRLFYLAAEWRHYLSHPIDALKVWEGGLVFYGGLAGAIVATLWYLRQKRLRFLTVTDLFAPGLSLGHAIGRLGCFASGCCHGREAPAHWWSVTFPDIPRSLAPHGIPLYPTQLIEAALSLLIFFVLLAVRRKKRFTGQLFLTYLLFYGISRALLEPLRADQARTFIIPAWLSLSQLIGLALVLVAGITYWRGLAKQGEGQ